MAVSCEHLQCLICRELYKKPRTLIPCLHSFCEACLYSNIMDQVSRGQVNEGFKCPLCTAFIAAPGSDKSPDEWATKFPLNQLLVSLLDTVKNQNRSETKLSEYSQTEIVKSNNKQYPLNCNSKHPKVLDSDRVISNETLKPTTNSRKDGQNVNTARINRNLENQPETGAFLNRSTEPTYVNFKIEAGCCDNNVSVCFEDSDYTKLAQTPGFVPDFSDERDYVQLRNDVIRTTFFKKESYVPDNTMPSDVLLPPPPPPCGSQPRTAQQHVSPVKTSSSKQHQQQALNCALITHHTPWHHHVKSYLEYGSQRPQTGYMSYRPTGYSILYGDF
ncbi:hypothetical protein ACJMK2_016643 [Sinanodonta woodiana]|uniref:RING-type domain-containing protein n=1 Tax=Sinanodonta woodiana TaxID=1069815 RepID=A0ABD3UXE7_SINWO